MQTKLLMGFAVLAIAAIGFFVWQKQSPSVEYRAAHIAFKYPDGYQEAQKSKLSSKHLESLVKLQASNPLAVIELYKEEGAIIGANVTKAPFLDYLESSVKKNQSVTRKDYKTLASERIKISDKEAGRLTYSYLGPDNKTTLYINFFLIPVGSDAYYLSVGSTNQARSDKDADKIQSTIKLN